MSAINHRPLGLTVAIVTLALDQLVKYTVTYPLALQSRADAGIEILPFFRLRWLENRGVSMGFFQDLSDDQRMHVVVVSLVVAGIAFIATLVIIALLMLAVDPAQVTKPVEHGVLLPESDETASDGRPDAAASDGPAPR